MKILLCSYLYSPSVGGIETMSRLLARHWRSSGHEVRVITTSPGETWVDEIEVIRSPGLRTVWQATRWCDVCVHNNISLAWAWSPLLARKPWVVVHQTWLRSVQGRVGWRERVKRLALRRACSVAISRAIAEALPVAARMIPNSYDDAVFFPAPAGAKRPHDLIFVGRLVSDKGVDVLIEGLALLADTGLRPGLTIVGAGPEADRLLALATTKGVAAQLRWTGVLRGAELAAELRLHRVMVVPSRWAEPFGIVALEGAACGCAVVGSAAGGLAQAIGPCGITFPNNDVPALAEGMRAALAGAVGQNHSARAQHLRRHQHDVVGTDYLNLFAEVVR